MNNLLYRSSLVWLYMNIIYQYSVRTYSIKFHLPLNFWQCIHNSVPIYWISTIIVLLLSSRTSVLGHLTSSTRWQSKAGIAIGDNQKKSRNPCSCSPKLSSRGDFDCSLNLFLFYILTCFHSIFIHLLCSICKVVFVLKPSSWPHHRV